MTCRGVNRLRRRCSAKQRDRDVVVSNRHSIFEFELLLQTQSTLEPLRSLFRIAHGQSKVADFSKCEWNLHLDRQLRSLISPGTVSRNERFHEAQVESSKASRGVWPKPLASRCSLGPI